MTSDHVDHCSTPPHPASTTVPDPGQHNPRQDLSASHLHPHAMRERYVRALLLSLRAGCSVRVDPRWILPPLPPHARRALEGDEMFERTVQAVASRSVPPLVIVDEHVPRLDIDLGDSPTPFKLVVGTHLLYACLKLGRHLGVMLCRDVRLDDTIVMLSARNPRACIAPIEWGTLFRRALARGLYESQAALAHRLDWPRSTVQRAVKLASMPEPLLQAFGAPQLLRHNDAEQLNQAIVADCRAALREAKRLARLTPRLERLEVLQRIRQAAGLSHAHGKLAKRPAAGTDPGSPSSTGTPIGSDTEHRQCPAGDCRDGLRPGDIPADAQEASLTPLAAPPPALEADTSAWGFAS